jgi:hypothetical protein
MVLIGGKITLSYAPRRACADCVLSSARARRVRAAHVLDDGAPGHRRAHTGANARVVAP